MNQQLVLAFLFCSCSAFVSWADEDAPDLARLEGATIDIQLVDGRTRHNAKVLQVVAGKTPGSVRSLKVTTGDSKRAVAVGAVKIDELFLAGQPLDVVYDRKRRELSHDPEKRKIRLTNRAAAEVRLAESNHRFWKSLTEPEHKKFLAAHRDFLENVRDALPHLQFRLIETEHFLFFTVLSPHEVDGYIRYLDEMYRELCGAFGVSPQSNIWCGKCVVIAFRSEPNYLLFESKVMQVAARGTQGICHSKADGTVIFAGWKGESSFAHTLVHETTHGFIHRYRSSMPPPSWLNEGIADWLADSIVRGEKIQRRRARSARLNFATGSLGNVFSAERIDGAHYGTASSLVDILVGLDRGNQFKQFFDDIKDGHAAEKSLKTSFGIGYAELEQLYGRAIGAAR